MWKDLEASFLYSPTTAITDSISSFLDLDQSMLYLSELIHQPLFESQPLLEFIRFSGPFLFFPVWASFFGLAHGWRTRSYLFERFA